jgi:hypothetical protein
VKRLIALLAVGAAAAAVLAVPSVAGDTKGPPCANIVGGDGSYAYYEADLETPLANPYVDWTFVLGAPACDVTTYTLEIYNLQGTTLLATLNEADVAFLYTFATGTAPAEGVCIVGTTFFRGRVADRAPDEGCAPLDPLSGGGVGFQ